MMARLPVIAASVGTLFWVLATYLVARWFVSAYALSCVFQ